jgi:glycosyltransferase involved in cell wall biosynthesis
LIEAIDIVRKSGVEALGKIFGSSTFGTAPASDYELRLRASAGVGVNICGHVAGASLGKELRGADVFCCPSIWHEPFGMVNVEAMATGLPVVATNRGGIPEIFKEGGGVLLPPDDASALAKTLRELALDPDRRDRLGKEAYSSYQRNFSWEVVHRRYAEVVSEC